MKINPTSAYQAYNKMAEHNRSPRQDPSIEDGVQRTGHTDQIEISSAGARNMEICQLAKAISVREPASLERLESLRSAIKNGTYHIPTEDLAGAVMRRWFIV